MRLILHTAAYWLVLTIRAAIPKPHSLARAEFATIRLRLLKLAARISKTATRVRRVRRRMSRRHAVPQPGEYALLPTAIDIGPNAPFNSTPHNPQRLTHLPDQHAVQPATAHRVRHIPRCLSGTSPGAPMNKTG